jgi:ankyrin repeat protein
LELLRELLASGQNLNAADETGLTALHYAVRIPRLDCLIALIEADANVNVCNSYGFTPLHGAAEQGSLSKTRYLLENGANPDVQLTHPFKNYPTGFTPKDVAAACGHTHVVRWIEKLIKIYKLK